MTFNPRQLFNSPRRIAALVIVLALGLLFWGRLLIHDVPRTAVAVPDNAGETAVQRPQTGKPSAGEVMESAKSPQIPADDVEQSRP